MLPLVLVMELLLSEVLVPVEELCQYQVTPLGGLVLVNTVFPQLLAILGAVGVGGTEFIL